MGPAGERVDLLGMALGKGLLECGYGVDVLLYLLFLPVSCVEKIKMEEQRIQQHEEASKSKKSQAQKFPVKSALDWAGIFVRVGISRNKAKLAGKSKYKGDR